MQHAGSMNSDAGFDLNIKTDWEREVSNMTETSVLTFTNRGEIRKSVVGEQLKVKGLGIATDVFRRAETSSHAVNKVTKESESSIRVAFCKSCSRKLLRNKMFAHFMVSIVILDAFLTASDINYRARGDVTPQYVVGLSTLCLSLYVLELTLQFFARGRKVIRKHASCTESQYVEGEIA